MHSEFPFHWMVFQTCTQCILWYPGQLDKIRQFILDQPSQRLSTTKTQEQLNWIAESERARTLSVAVLISTGGTFIHARHIKRGAIM